MRSKWVRTELQGLLPCMAGACRGGISVPFLYDLCYKRRHARSTTSIAAHDAPYIICVVVRLKRLTSVHTCLAIGLARASRARHGPTIARRRLAFQR